MATRKRLARNRIARWVVTIGGLAIVASILAILLFILIEVWPLTRPARVAWQVETSLEQAATTDGRPAEALALVADEHRTKVATLGADGTLRAFQTADGSLVVEQPLVPPPGAVEDVEEVGGDAESDTGDGTAAEVASAEGQPPALVAGAGVPGEPLFTAAFSDGRVALLPVEFPVRFEGDQRVVDVAVGDPVWIQVATGDDASIETVSGRLAADGGASVAALLADGGVQLVQRSARRNMLTGEVTESFSSHRIQPPSPVRSLLLDGLQRTLYAAAGTEILKWSLDDGVPGDVRSVSAGPSPVAAMTLLIGDRALVTGHQDGSLRTWFPTRVPDDPTQTELKLVREFPSHETAILRLAPSLRDKGFLALDDAGGLGLYYSTSQRVLWRGEAPEGVLDGLTFTPKADGAFLIGSGRLASLAIDNPHPETSFKALFGKVWYEGADGPEYTWQSTGGTDDFEPKLSLTPLMIGTLKGTVYSMLLAVPLGVFGAMYASQFMHPKLLRYVKPTVEVMAALPSVVLGFLAGLWLAPRLEAYFPALILAVVVLPAVVLLAGLGWMRLPRGVRGRLWTGSEVVVFGVAIAIGIGLCLALSQPFENEVFAGSFQTWLRETFGLPYDQRNAVVIGLAMGFAVIPIIFAISEDAFSNVPRNLVAGSLALGANRWQTVTRVVLPSASPGIFSAIMIGFGRAIGETMIVLMATGNTPIMDWNPFNGFRTLSANIAVEIPEAPHNGTLYRVLFLAALLLFVSTFVVNTVAEIVRQRLRKRYSQL